MMYLYSHFLRALTAEKLTMQNVAPTRSLTRRSRDLQLAAALIFLLGAALAVAGIAMHVINLVVPFNRGFEFYDLTRKALLLIGAMLSLASLLMALRAVTWRTDNTTAFELGEQLAAQLDQRYIFIRNISKGATGYVDAVLVSHHGLLALRITRRKGEFFNEGGQWLRRRRGKWRPMRWNPTREAAASAVKLKAHLRDYGLTQAPLYAAVVFMRDAPDVRLKLRQPALPVIHAGQLIADLSDTYFAEARLPASTVQEIVNLLYH